MRFSQLVPWKHELVGRVLSGTSWENQVMYGGLCQHTRVVLYLLYTQPEISFNYDINSLKKSYVIQTAHLAYL